MGYDLLDVREELSNATTGVANGQLTNAQRAIVSDPDTMFCFDIETDRGCDFNGAGRVTSLYSLAFSSASDAPPTGAPTGLADAPIRALVDANTAAVLCGADTIGGAYVVDGSGRRGIVGDALVKLPFEQIVGGADAGKYRLLDFTATMLLKQDAAQSGSVWGFGTTTDGGLTLDFQTNGQSRLYGNRNAGTPILQGVAGDNDGSEQVWTVSYAQSTGKFTVRKNGAIIPTMNDAALAVPLFNSVPVFHVGARWPAAPGGIAQAGMDGYWRFIAVSKVNTLAKRTLFHARVAEKAPGLSIAAG